MQFDLVLTKYLYFTTKLYPSAARLGLQFIYMTVWLQDMTNDNPWLKTGSCSHRLTEERHFYEINWEETSLLLVLKFPSLTPFHTHTHTHARTPFNFLDYQKCAVITASVILLSWAWHLVIPISALESLTVVMSVIAQTSTAERLEWKRSRHCQWLFFSLALWSIEMR